MGIEFRASGTPRDVAQAIEQYAHGQGRVSAIVVPWESTASMLSMAVTAVKADGWAIEHTNLGTVRLTDGGDGTTSVAVVAHDSREPLSSQLTGVFEQFAQQLQQRFRA